MSKRTFSSPTENMTEEYRWVKVACRSIGGRPASVEYPTISLEAGGEFAPSYPDSPEVEPMILALAAEGRAARTLVSLEVDDFVAIQKTLLSHPALLVRFPQFVPLISGLGVAADGSTTDVLVVDFVQPES